MNGIVSDIISMSVNDGPGIRTSVFLKGCPLKCAWCHNPEMQSPLPQALVLPTRCRRCGACFACPSGARGKDGQYLSARCVGCGQCVTLCPYHACRVSGQVMSAEEVLQKVLPDRPFFRGRGGVTISGGEPLTQAGFTLEIARLMKENGIGVVIETSGCAPFKSIEKLLPCTDRFLYDWKVTDPKEHLKWTGRDNRLIRENLVKLCESGARVVLRCPLIPGVNDTDTHFEGIAALTRELPALLQVDLLPYHALGNDKRRQLSLPPDGFTVPDGSAVRMWHEKLKKLCAVPVCL
ncbi:MAG: glycyl-radical enzyme activating protein [Clostridia bacterium]|nr:glycyl-radical enzyme activating protein [Clostridia bacterium]